MGSWEGSQVSSGLVLQGLGSGYRCCIWLQWDPVCHQALQGKTRKGVMPALWHILKTGLCAEKSPLSHQRRGF